MKTMAGDDDDVGVVVLLSDPGKENNVSLPVSLSLFSLCSLSYLSLCSLSFPSLISLSFLSPLSLFSLSSLSILSLFSFSFLSLLSLSLYLQTQSTPFRTPLPLNPLPSNSDIAYICRAIVVTLQTRTQLQPIRIKQRIQPIRLK
jgi:hypothetical protein